MNQFSHWLKSWTLKAIVFMYTLISTILAVPIATNQTGFLWGVNGGVVWFREGIGRTEPQGLVWSKMDGNLIYVSASARGLIWGVTNDGKAVIRLDVTPQNLKGTSWQEVDAAAATKTVAFKQIAACQKQVWVVGTDNSTMYRAGITAANYEGTDWIAADNPGTIQHIAVSEKGHIWGVNENNQAVIRQGKTSDNPQGIGWKIIASSTPIKQLAVDDDSVWAIGTDETVWLRKNISQDAPEGTDWVKVDGLLTHISVSSAGLVWGIDPTGIIYFRNDVSDAAPMGTAWTKIPGRLAQLEGGHFMMPVVIPTGFIKQTEQTESIGIGSQNGTSQVWFIGLDGNALFHYDQLSGTNAGLSSAEQLEAVDAQNKSLPTPLKSVSISSDGIIYVIDAHGQAHQYDADKEIFNTLPQDISHEFSKISVGNKDTIWAVDSDTKSIFQYTSSGWVQQGTGNDVAAGLDGTVFSLQKGGIANRYLGGGKWQAVPGMTFSHLAVGNKDNILGIGLDQALYQYSNGKWLPIKNKDGKTVTGINRIAINATGDTGIVDLANNIYCMLKGSIGSTSASGSKSAAAPAASPAAKKIHARTAKQTQTPTPSLTQTSTPSSSQTPSSTQTAMQAPSSLPSPSSTPTSAHAQETEATPVQKDVIIVPDGFSSEVGGTLLDVAVGSRNGALEAWCISVNGNNLLRYNQFAMGKDDPWEKMIAMDDQGKALSTPLSWISVSSDGVMCVLDSKGRAYLYDWDKKTFSKMLEGSGNTGLSLEFISVGNRDNIWAIDGKNRDILQYTNAGWVVVHKSEAIYVAAGVDGTVIALTETGEAFSYVGNNSWDDLPGIFARVAVGDAHNIWAIGVDGELYTITGEITGPSVALPSIHTSSSTSLDVEEKTKVNKWRKIKRARKAHKKAGVKKAGQKKVATQKKSHKKGHKKSWRKVQTASETSMQMTRTATGEQVQSENQGSAFADKWARIKSSDGQLASGFLEVAVNAAGTVFLTDIENEIYHKGDAGFTITNQTGGQVEGKPAEPAPDKMTRIDAQKSGKLNIEQMKKVYRRGRKQPGQKVKHRLARKSPAKPQAKKVKKAKQANKRALKAPQSKPPVAKALTAPTA